MPLYLQLGTPQFVALERAAEVQVPGPANGNGMTGNTMNLAQAAARLAEHMKARPDDLRGWTLLGRAYSDLGRPDEAARAFGRAVDLKPDDASLQISYGEALMQASDGEVTPPAMAAFQRALELQPGLAAARFYLGLADRQAGRLPAAYDRWLKLARELPEDSPRWRLVAEHLQAVAGNLGRDLAKDLPAAAKLAEAPAIGPGPDEVRAAAQMSPQQRSEFIRGMVDRLAGRLAKHPDDFEGWMRLGRSYLVLGEQQKAADAYARAAQLHPDDPAPLDGQATALVAGAGPMQALPAEAEAVLRRLLKLDPKNPRALWFLGLADAQAGRREAAIEKWQRLLPLLPADGPQRQRLQNEIDRLRRQQG